MTPPTVPGAFAPMQRVKLGDCISRALSLYTKEIGWFIGWGLAVSAFDAALAAATAGWALLLGLVLTIPFKIGLYAVADAAAHGKDVDFNTALAGFKRGPAYLLGGMQTLLLLAGLVAFVLPGLIVLVALTWSIPALYRRDMGAGEAIRHSFSLTRGHLGLTLAVIIIGMILSSIGTGTVILGAFTAPFMACLKTVAFEQISPRPTA